MIRSTNMEHVAHLQRMAIESWRGSPEHAALTAAIAALSAPQPPAEAQPVGEAVVWLNPDCEFGEPFSNVQTKRHTVPLYAHPPPSAPVGAEDRARHLLAAALRPHDRMASDWAMEPTFDGYAVAQRDALHAIAAALAPQPAAVDGALRAEVERLQAEIDNRWAQGVHTCHDECQRIACVLRRQRDFELKRAERLAEALRLIASPKRPDGTWNRDREACRQIAAEALRDHDQEGGE